MDQSVNNHIIEERSTAAALQDIRQRLEALDGASAIAATLDGLAASLGALDRKLTARLERLDERLDDQYDRVRAIESAVEVQLISLDTLSEALLRPPIR